MRPGGNPCSILLSRALRTGVAGLGLRRDSYLVNVDGGGPNELGALHDMAKGGTKIKDLARELGVTSRELIDRCRAEGVFIQNSITKVKPDSEKRIRSWYKSDDTSTAE